MKKKTIAGIMAFVLLIGAGVGVTLAYLSDRTSDVVNTFTVGKVDIDLYEHDLKTDGTLDQDKKVLGVDTYKIVPGSDQSKDPTVEVIANSEPCYVFVKITETDNSDPKYVDWAINETNWTALGTSYPGVYYKTIDSIPATNVVLTVLADNKVTYPATLTNAQLKAVSDRDKEPTLTFTAYAVQKSASIADAAAAWALVKDLGTDDIFATQTTN